MPFQAASLQQLDFLREELKTLLWEDIQLDQILNLQGTISEGKYKYLLALYYQKQYDQLKDEIETILLQR